MQRVGVTNHSNGRIKQSTPQIRLRDIQLSLQRAYCAGNQKTFADDCRHFCRVAIKV